MTPEEREAALARLTEFVGQQREADGLADKGSLERAADVQALYDDKHWVTEIEPPKKLINRGRPVDPESFSRFTKWLATKTPVEGRRAYQLRDAHELATNYLNQVQIKPSGERDLRPLKWLTKHDYGDRVAEVWREACKLAGNGAPDSSTVRRALTQWKHDNLPRSEHKTSARSGQALIDRWIADAHRIMLEYPERFAPALDEIMEEAERLLEEVEA